MMAKYKKLIIKFLRFCISMKVLSEINHRAQPCFSYSGEERASSCPIFSM